MPNTEHPPNEKVACTERLSLLGSLAALLGDDVFFVPCEWGTKKPLTYVERPFEATKTEGYRALFAVQDVNVAVYLGKSSGGPCAIDFDRDEDLTAFLAVNPGLELGAWCFDQ